MITANIGFLNNNLLVELPCNAADLQNRLNSMGVLTPPNIIGLDNGRTLKVNLHANDGNGEWLMRLIKPSDMLGKVNRACNAFYRLEVRQEITITEGIESGKLKSLDDVLDRIDKLKNRDYEKSR